jgi:nucleoid DNA-binding protein
MQRRGGISRLIAWRLYLLADPLKKSEFISHLAKRLSIDEYAAEQCLDAVTDTLYEVFQSGHGVTLPGFGGFYLDKRGDKYAFKFNPGQKLRALFGWSTTRKK